MTETMIVLSLVAATGVAIVIILWLWPEFGTRVLFWLPLHVIYRIRVYGRENIPEKGPVLFVCNHVSYLDAFFVFFAQRRPVYFVIWAPFTKVPGLRLLLHFAKVIPIDGSSGPRAILKSLKVAAERMAEGKVVCIFAEGSLSRTGFMMPFHRGFENILKHCPAPIVPVCLDQVWGSIFSFHRGKAIWKLPLRIPYPVNIAFGKPMPPTTTAIEVRQVVQKLSAECAIDRGGKRLPIHRKFVRLAARHPFWSCMVDPATEKNYKFGEVLAGTWILSKKLKPIVGDSQMVGVWLPPSVGGAFANVALPLLGKVPVNLNYTSGPDNVRAAIKQCNIRHVLTARLFTNKVPIDPGEGVELVYLEDFRKEISTFQRVWHFLMVVLLPGFVLDRWVLGLKNHRTSDLATVIFSSGSTGDPKGVMLTHRNIAANTESMIQAISPDNTDRLLGILPFFHSFGFTVTLWVPLQVGASVLYHPDPRQAKEIGDLCKKYECTIYLTTPTFLRFSMRRSEPDDFRSLRILMCGAEKLPKPFADEFQEKFGVRPLEGYGCTELSPVVAANVPDIEVGGVKQIGNRPGTIGQPVPGVAVKIVNPDTFEELTVKQDGLLLVYGANVMRGYLGKDELTKSVLRDGWYVTGDIARYDEDGFITITDRLSRFSKIGGEMVPHLKIEEELQAILNTTDRVCAVTAVPDEKKGERLVVLHTTLTDTTTHQLWQELGKRGLPNLWVPAERDFLEVPELPVLGSGKLDLKRVKELALEMTRGAAVGG